MKQIYKNILKHPRITEKASMLGEQNVYTFNVHKDATKNEVKKAIDEIYKFKAIKIRMIKIPSKNIFSRGKKGIKKGGKKALVYLRPEDKIEFL